jgi:hypothetical protein
VEGVEMLGLESNSYASVVGKEALVFNDFDRDVTVTVRGYDPDGETKAVRILSAALGYVTPQTGNIVLLSIYQGIYLPHLNHNLLSTTQMTLHDVILNETPKIQCLEPTNLSHAINLRGDNVDDVMIIPSDLHGVVSCFPTFRPTQE